ncbi:hypothetical protein CBR_g63094 [Chara braunii]|uniref:CCHC-type domain-containing protein n=1 Tax=Chara braunii TaxID=69332 RepID=A0A388K907_CHABU|nr:hypothetical protein CBR_g63094 [Chara braunii]|eukprot:GBG66511.1 hypothetical protein CBR_g63094 [Chara braunii]
MSDEVESRRGHEGGGALLPDGRRYYKCGESGHFISDCTKSWRARVQGRAFVPLAPPPTAQRMGRTATGGDAAFRRSRSTDSNERGRNTEDTNTLIREYFVQMAEERQSNMKREEERRRVDDEARREKEARRALREEQRRRQEEKRDVRLMWIIRGEMKKEQEEDLERYAIKGKKIVRTMSRTDPAEDEKERLRRWIAQRTSGGRRRTKNF